MNKKKTFSIVSLGCFRNTYDSEVIAEKFCGQGYKFLPQGTLAKDKKVSILLINTCGFIDKAKEESINAIKDALQLKKNKKIDKIFVFGCLVQRYHRQLKKFFPEVDQWQGVEKFSSCFKKRKSLISRTYDFLKICEGCLNNCSFCSIPAIKGPLSSRPLEEVIREAKFLDRSGIKELNIIGQDISGWGKDLGSGYDIVKLLRAVVKATSKIPWIRLIYTHPRNVTTELLELIAKEPRICKYIDLPIQHINDRILKLMNRGFDRKQTQSLIYKIRKIMPDCVIRTSVITGFPTETEREFQELLRFLKEIRFERLGVFTYSREEGTPAYNLRPQVHYRRKERRFRQIMEIQQGIAYEINNSLVGKPIDVLIEGKESGIFIGRTQYDAPEVDGVVFARRKGLKVGGFYRLKVVDSYEYDLVAE
ncbi:MAG: MiaB/RimO family radical SAM methylthiotransferase [Candidatus Omnitrophica bacterium]|nr:MiaB/RimO family radical SAM methylthiotransferase [Candidatus Omnitrophota bacterium]MDD5430108.1 MiaB/RimO family radical SAM methylthiotransferase [Candidatus Omnitrophota bacterium]